MVLWVHRSVSGIPYMLRWRIGLHHLRNIASTLELSK